MIHTKKFSLRPHLWLITVLGLIAPRRLRQDWRQEWEAELQRRESQLAMWDRLDRRSKLDLLRRSTSAFWDVIWLQPRRMEDEMVQDLRFALRMLRKQPAFTLFAAVTLALGIGAVTTIFSALNAVLLRSLPYPAPERLTSIDAVKTTDRTTFGTLSYLDFIDFKSQNQAFERVSAYQTRSFSLTTDEGAVRLRGVVADSDLFPLLGNGVLYGRSFTPEEDQPGGGRAVILSYALWRSRYGSEPGVIGRAAQINGQSYTVIGVAPPGFDFPIQSEPTELWVNFAVDRESAQNPTASRGNHYLNGIGRLKPGGEARQAEAQLAAVAARLEREYPNENHDFSVRVTPLLEQITRDSRRSLWMLTTAVGLMLIIACANIAGLLLARGLTRRHELGVRAALGASSGRLLRQMLTESLLLSLVGGALGAALATLGVDAVRRMTIAGVPRLAETRLDGRALLFTLAIATLTGVATGLAPAWQTLKIDLSTSLNKGGRGSAGNRSRMRDALVITQTAVAVVLLVGAGLLLQSFLRLQGVNHGFQSDRLLSLRVTLPTGVYRQPRDIAAFHQRVIANLQALPGVSAFSSVTPLPMTGADIVTGFNIEGRPNPSSLDFPYQTRLYLIGADYFRTMGVALRQGREFDARDELYGRPVVIINEAFARKYFPDQNPIGQRINPAMSPDDRPLPMREIIAVASNTRSKTLSESPVPEVYLHLPQCPATGAFNLLFRSSVDPQSLASMARASITAVDRNAPISHVHPFDYYIEQVLKAPRFHASLVSVFAALALLLAAIGLYGVLAYAVSQRTAEIGLRMALGAKSVDVVGLILREALLLVATGVGVGFVASLLTTRLISNFLFGLAPYDPATIGMATVTMIAVAALAAWLPARRAARVDPMTALQRE